MLPRTTEGLETGWHLFPIQIRPESGISRARFQAFMESRGVDTRMVWSGNILRQPAFRTIEHRVAGSLDNADRVMATGLILPCNHGMDDEDVDYVCATVEEFVQV